MFWKRSFKKKSKGGNYAFTNTIEKLRNIQGNKTTLIDKNQTKMQKLTDEKYRIGIP